MSHRLAGKVAIITDGETIMGADIAQEFARQGASVFIQGAHGGLAGSIAEVIRSEGGKAIVYQGDLTQEAQALDFVQAAINQYGHIDLLLTNAEICPSPQSWENLIPDATWTQSIIRSTFLTTHYALPYLQQTQGCILAVCAEIYPFETRQDAPHEAALKAWLNSFIQGVAQEQMRFNISANFICSRFPDAHVGLPTPGFADSASTMMIEHSDIPRLCSFLASEQAHYVTQALYTIKTGAPGIPPAVSQKPQLCGLESLVPHSIEAEI